MGENFSYNQISCISDVLESSLSGGILLINQISGISVFIALRYMQMHYCLCFGGTDTAESTQKP